jgi:tRNA dimethylallyltransferase
MPVINAYFLVGPTASGKSEVAQWIAERHGYDILSADSMQIYRGMDIGTAKAGREWQSRVRYYGIDLCGPGELYSVWNYREYAVSILRERCSAGRRVLVTGGTGLYIKALVMGLAPVEARDPAVREHWNRVFREGGVGALEEALLEKSPEAYRALSDRKNPRRLIRALERVDAGHHGVERTWKDGNETVPVAGLMVAPAALNSRIEVRTGEMYRNGLVEEAKNLLQGGLLPSETARQAIGYAEVFDLLDGRCSREDAMARTVVRTRQLAKRQRTWFRHQLNVKWIDVTAAMEVSEIAERTLEHWRKYGPTEIAE